MGVEPWRVQPDRSDPEMYEVAGGYLVARGLPIEDAEIIAAAIPAIARVKELEGHIRDFICALDRGYLACKDDSAFIEALRHAVAT